MRHCMRAQDSRRLALELAGKWRDPEAWSEAVREVRAKTSAAAAAVKQQAKDSRRTQKRSEDDPAPGDAAAAAAGASVVTLRTGLWVTVEEASETEDDMLVMLSKGIAYATAEGTEPVVKRLYQQVGTV
eukprot:28873-Chlamydomonas_euryale.AAC.1